MTEEWLTRAMEWVRLRAMAQGETPDRFVLPEAEWDPEPRVDRHELCPELRFGIHQRSDHEPDACRNCGCLLKEER